MNINNIPTEVFVQILEYVPLKNASAIMRVNRKWYQEYRGIIQRQDLVKFEELLYSHWSDWNIPIRLIPYFNWNKFLIYKLDSFCQNFKYPLFLMKCLQIIYESLKLEMVKIDKEREVIDKLMAHYEASSDFEGWFPEWLWDRRTKNRLNSGINISAYNRVYTLMKMLKEERTIDYFIFQL